MSKNSNLPATTGSAYDAESDSMIVVTKEMQDRLWEIQRYRIASLLTDCVLLAEIADNKLYLAGGFQSMEQFVNATCDFAYRTAQNRIRIGRSSAAAITPADLKSLLYGDEQDEGDATIARQQKHEQIQSISKLGIGKLLAVASLKDYSVSDLIEGKEFTAPDGTVLTVEDFDLMKRDAITEISKQLEASERKYRAELSKRDEAIKKIKAEHQADENLKAENARLRSEIDEIQNTVGEQWADKESTLRALSKAQASILDAIATVVNRPVDIDSAPQLKEAVVALHVVAKRCLENIEEHYGNALALATFDRQVSGVESRFDFEAAEVVDAEAGEGE